MTKNIQNVILKERILFLFEVNRIKTNYCRKWIVYIEVKRPFVFVIKTNLKKSPVIWLIKLY